MSSLESIDAEIRSALHRKKLRIHHACPNTLVVDELGVSHGKQRIDIAVFNGTIHGYEIKSSKDNLKRLPSQIEAYVDCFEKLSIVTAPNHLSGVLNIAPYWCEIIIATKGKRGGIHFSSFRKGMKNPDLKIHSVLHFLWKKEATNFLKYLDAEEILKYKTRKELYDRISKLASFEDTLKWIKVSFMERKNWILDL